ncbi:thrombospondin type 3 repeat-containing protein, partial [Tenacibaculum piscium]|uniref:thrombospondin type 3 repeat-containing protein n=1 Tax=Tenacibaculum piscium TaxID=1458515 RepID=UPI001EFB0EA0
MKKNYHLLIKNRLLFTGLLIVSLFLMPSLVLGQVLNCGPSGTIVEEQYVTLANGFGYGPNENTYGTPDGVGSASYYDPVNLTFNNAIKAGDVIEIIGKSRNANTSREIKLLLGDGSNKESIAVSIPVNFEQNIWKTETYTVPATFTKTTYNILYIERVVGELYFDIDAIRIKTTKCNPCSIPTDAPQFSKNPTDPIEGEATFNLSTFETTITNKGAKNVKWYYFLPASVDSEIPSGTQVLAGTYYALFEGDDNGSPCYSDPTAFTIISDFDDDGIVDAIDIDDDNDGIIDKFECTTDLTSSGSFEYVTTDFKYNSSVKTAIDNSKYVGYLNSEFPLYAAEDRSTNPVTPAISKKDDWMFHGTVDWSEGQYIYLSFVNPTAKLNWPLVKPSITDGGAFTIFSKSDEAISNNLTGLDPNQNYAFVYEMGFLPHYDDNGNLKDYNPSTTVTVTGGTILSKDVPNFSEYSASDYVSQTTISMTLDPHWKTYRVIFKPDASGNVNVKLGSKNSDAVIVIDAVEVVRIPVDPICTRSLNIDADGDGCDDATEAGLTALTPAEIAQGVGANGLYDALETSADSGILKDVIDTTKPYDPSVQGSACPPPNPCTVGASTNGTPTTTDSDGDGVNNSCDLDDDNDGILDAEEDANCTGNIVEEIIINETFEAGTVGTVIPKGSLVGVPGIDGLQEAYNSHPGNTSTTNVGEYKSISGVDGNLSIVIDANGGGIVDQEQMSSFIVLNKVNLLNGEKYTVEADFSLGLQDTGSTLTNGSNEYGIAIGAPGQDPIWQEDYAGAPDGVFLYGHGSVLIREPNSSLPNFTAPPRVKGWFRQSTTYYVKDNGSGILHLYADNKGYKYNVSGVLGTAFIANEIDLGAASNYPWLNNAAISVSTDEYVDNVIVKINHCDNDNDGIPNYLDTDSDNDGCPDAIEANENVTSVQLDADKRIDIANQGGVDINGVPNLVNSGGTADGSNNTQGQGTNTNVLTATKIEVKTQPTNKVICLGGNAVFTAEMLSKSTTIFNAGVPDYTGIAGNTTGLVYQWVEQIEGAGSWNVISNGGIYNNATTASLTLTNPPLTTSTNKYRLVTTSTSNTCSEVISDEVLLTVNALPVASITGLVTQPTCAVSTGSFQITGYDSGDTYAFTPSVVGVSGTGLVTANAGSYTFTVTDTDGTGCTSLASSNIVVNAQPATPSAPVVGAVTQPTCAVSTGSFQITGYDSGDTYAFTPSVVGVSGTGLVTANAGSYTFTVTDTDGTGCTSLASSNIVVNTQPNCPPVAQDDSASTTVDALVNVDVLANNGNGLDSDVDGDTLTITEINGTTPVVGTPISVTGGTVTLKSDGTLDIQPDGTGTAIKFPYEISDGKGGTDTADVDVTIDNTAPVAQDDTA